jgi:hypothetical protein
MNRRSRFLVLTTGLLAFGAVRDVSGESSAKSTRADLHVAVFSSGFLVDTQRQVTYGDRSRRVLIKTHASGTAAGETPDAGIDIDRIDLGTQWRLNPKTKTFYEEKYQKSLENDGRPSAPSGEPVTLKISKIDPKVSGPLGTATINGLPCQSYTIRITADFSNPQTGTVVARETMLEKLWVTAKAPEIVKFRKAEENFRDALTAVYGTERASFRWLLREFNKMILEAGGNTGDFRTLQTAYLGARASIEGVTVRQLVGWNWRPLDESAPGSDAANDMNAFVGSIAAGLGAPPDEEGKKPMSDEEKPRWVQDLEKDLGRSGPTAMILEEVIGVRSVAVNPDFFEIPNDYRKL